MLTPSRWTLVERLQVIGPCNLLGLGRDVKAAHRDVSALIAEGLIEKDESDAVHVPFACIHAEFDMAHQIAT